MFEEKMDMIIKELEPLTKILILQHQNPDGDSLGSALAFGSLLTRMGKRVTLAVEGKVPEYLGFLPGSKRIRQGEKLFLDDYDVLVLIEAQSVDRTGVQTEKKDFKGPVIVIDHHQSDRKASDLVINLPAYSSTSEIIWHFFRKLDMPLKKEEALFLFVGIYTDTGRFSEANTTAHSLRVSADLVETGELEINRIYQKIYGEVRPERMLLLGKALNTLKIEGGICWMELRKEYFGETGAVPEDSKNLINFCKDIKDVDVALVFREEGENTVKVTMRSKKRDVYKIAKELGGGGHNRASGATVRGDMETVRRKVMELLEKETGL